MKPVILAVVIVLGLLVVGALGVCGWLWFKRPLTVFEWNTRNALKAAGLAKKTIVTPVGPQVVFSGGTGPLVVLLHGAGDQAGTWFKVAPELVKDHALLIPDLAGHGDSAPSTGPISVESVLTAFESVLAAHAGGQKATLVGNSLGAWIATLVAQRHPEQVAMVVCVDGGALKGANAHARVLPQTVAEARESVAQTRDAESAPIPDFVLADIVRHARLGSLARLAATADTMDRWVIDEAALAAVAVPVHMIWGASDRLVPLDYAQRMHAALPESDLVTIPKCGHAPQLECPSAFLAVLRPILQGQAR